MQLDPVKYRHHLDGFDMSEEEKLRFMEEVWRIAQSYVDRTFGLLPEQILLGIDGTKCSKRACPELDSAGRFLSTFNDAAQG